MEVIDIIRIANGKIAEHWGILDMQSVVMQITQIKLSVLHYIVS